jgi:polar amino acid transport system ATP-binding protein
MIPSSLLRNFGLVFQGFNLFPHLTILENLIKAPMVVKKLKREDAKALALPFLEKVGLLSHINYYPSQLSGGQQQRAAIARALTMTPNVMMYDEPTSALDPWLSEEVFRVMRQLAAEEMTQIVVTHEVQFVRELADKVIFIEDGEIVEVGTPEELFDTPKDPRTRQFLKRGEKQS